MDLLEDEDPHKRGCGMQIETCDVTSHPDIACTSMKAGE